MNLMPSEEHGHRSLLIHFSPVNSGSLERCSVFPSGTGSVGTLMYNLVKGGWALWLAWYSPLSGGKRGSSLPAVMPAEGSCSSSLQEQGGVQRPHTQASALFLSLSLQTLPPAQENGTPCILAQQKNYPCVTSFSFPISQLKSRTLH